MRWSFTDWLIYVMVAIVGVVWCIWFGAGMYGLR